MGWRLNLVHPSCDQETGIRMAESRYMEGLLLYVINHCFPCRTCYSRTLSLREDPLTGDQTELRHIQRLILQLYLRDPQLTMTEDLVAIPGRMSRRFAHAQPSRKVQGYEAPATKPEIHTLRKINDHLIKKGLGMGFKHCALEFEEGLRRVYPQVYHNSPQRLHPSYMPLAAAQDPVCDCSLFTCGKMDLVFGRDRRYLPFLKLLQVFFYLLFLNLAFCFKSLQSPPASSEVISLPLGLCPLDPITLRSKD
ncbi:hypothetical protein VNO77_19095 [Canavalia gladiata]|uniref:Uncharacterized protein n=1 Tax=Canavalia gladiata TaxID=3824 RepID=A0AAN9LQD4_CANGL